MLYLITYLELGFTIDYYDNFIMLWLCV